MPAEARGVTHSLFDTLKSNRMIALRSGAHILSDTETATFICENPDVLARTLPLIVQWGFAARDDEGALYSPHLLQREIRRQEREQRRAEREESLRQFEAAQAAGLIPADDTLKGYQAKINGGSGGRPRKGETKGQARLRRAQEAEEAMRQRHMPLMRSMPGHDQSKTENPIQNQNRFSVSTNSVSKPVSSVPLDVDTELDNFPIPKPTSDGTEETAKPEQAKTQLSPAVINDTVKQVLQIANFTEGKRHQFPAIRKWLQDGCPPEVLIAAVRDHRAVMDSRPQHMGAFQAAIRAAWEQYQVPQTIAAPEPEQPEWEKKARADLAEDRRKWSEMLKQLGNFGTVQKVWAEKQSRLGRPTELALEAYLTAYRPKEDAA
ncbi:hypothetical protein [Acetobacter sp.]|uniref:hypothetical protein n=1 Tax=Acetobacter sp. TaxID=440 RepID=UPI0039E8C814